MCSLFPIKEPIPAALVAEHPRGPRWAARFDGRTGLALVFGAQFMIIFA